MHTKIHQEAMSEQAILKLQKESSIKSYEEIWWFKKVLRVFGI